MQSQNPYAPPAAALSDVHATSSDAGIDALPVSEKWKKRFKAITRAGGIKLPNIKKLSKTERKDATGLNFLAFLFGPIYYASKGMWKKGIFIFAICALVIIALSFALEYFGYGEAGRSAGFGVSAIYAIRANIDYYKKMVLNDNGWW